MKGLAERVKKLEATVSLLNNRLFTVLEAFQLVDKNNLIIDVEQNLTALPSSKVNQA